MGSDSRVFGVSRGFVSKIGIGRLRNRALWRTFTRVLFSVVLILLLLFARSSQANHGGSRPQQPVAARDSVAAFTDALDRRVPRLIDQYGVPGVSIALIRDGEPVWSGTYGYADLAEKRPMGADAIFRAESISKSVTAWGVMRLVEQGLLNLDDPVQHYLGSWTLPESDYDEQAVTVRRLLSNSAGMPLGTIGDEYAPGSAMPSPRDYMVGEARLIQEPGSSFSYSDSGFNVLEILVEEVTGRDFAEYMQTEVLNPLGMTNSSFAWNETLAPALATGYELGGAPVPPYVYPVKGSGGLFAPADDIARFVAAGMTGTYGGERTVLTGAGIRQLHAPQIEIPGVYGFVADSYGFGHFVETLPDGRQAVWHGGQGHGWMTHFHAVPESGDGIVILTNSQRSWPFIAQVLREWAEWAGVGPVKFSRISHAITGLRIVIGLVVLASLWLVYRLLRGLGKGNRRLAPLARDFRARRLLQMALGLAVIAVLTWSAAQPYLMVTSIFPGTASSAGIALVALATTGITSALFPRVGE